MVRWLVVCSAWLALAVPVGGDAALPPAPHPVGAAPLLRPGILPRLPFHGYRQEHRSGVQLRFDARLGVYVVSDREATYFFRDAFLRIHRGAWERSTSPHGPWQRQRAEWVPIRLRAEHYAQERL